MYEIKSCGTTIDFVEDHFRASTVYDQCNGPHVQMFKYVPRGKVVVAEKFNHHRIPMNQRNGV